MIITLGIDPGKGGALAVLGDGRHILFTAATPVYKGKYLTSQMRDLLLPFAGRNPWEWAKQAQDLFGLLVDTLAESEVPEPGEEYDKAYNAAIDHLNLFEDQVKYAAIYCVIEKQRGRKGMGAETVLQAGRGWGIWLGLLSALGISHEEIASGLWQRGMGVYATGVEPPMKKAIHVERANQLFPEANIKVSQDGIADALLMAAYAYRRYMGKN